MFKKSTISNFLQLLSIPLLLLLAFSALFALFPEVDTKFAMIFYDKSQGFFFNQSAVVKLVDKATIITMSLVIISLVGAACLGFILNNQALKAHKRHVIYLILVLVVGPGLVINVVLKDNWGRARPHQIIEFGGEKKFSAPWVISNQCERNCAFVSGHAAVGFFGYALAFLYYKKRKPVILYATIAGCIIGFVRILQGKHFLSDIIFSGIIVYMVAAIICCVFLHEPVNDE